MASGKIGFGDAFDGDFLKRMEALNKEFKEFQKTFKSLIKESKNAKELIKTSKSLNDINKASKKAAVTTKKLSDEEKKFARIQKQINFELSDAGKKYARLNEQKKQAAAANRKLAQSQDKGRVSTNKWSKAIGSFAFKFNTLGNIAANAVSKIVSQISAAVKESIALASEVRGVEQAFLGIKDSKRVMLDLTKATQGTVSEMQLMQNAIKADNFKIPMDVLAKGLEFATKRAAQTGESVDYLVDSFTTGLGRESVMILDNLGISAVELNKEVKLTGDFMTAVGNITERELKKMGDVMLTDAQRMAKLAASASNAKAQFGKLILKGLIPFVNIGNKISDSANKQSDAIIKEQNNLNRLVGAATSVTISETARLRVIEDIQELYPDFIGNIDAEKVSNEDLLTSLSKVNQGYRERIKLQVLQEILSADQNKLNKAIAKEITLTGELNSAKAALLREQEHYDDLVKRGVAGDALNNQVVALGIAQDRYDGINKRLGRNAEGQEKYESAINKTTAMVNAQLAVINDLGEEVADNSEEEVELTEAQIKARNKLNEAYALSQKLLSQIKPPEDLGADFLKDLAFEDLILDSISDTDLDNMDFSWFSDAFKDDGEEAAKTAESIFEAMFRIGEAHRAREKAATDLAAEERLATEQSVVNSINGLVTESFNIFSSINQRKQNSLDDRLENGLISEKAYGAEINKLRKRQDALQKAQAIFSIAVNTAVAAMMVAGQTGVGAVIAVPLVLALGALQIAAVLAEPMPQYAKGTDSSLAGPAIVGEKGQELKVDPSGKMSLTPGKPSLDYLKKGTKIVPADVTEQLLRYAAVANGFEGKADDQSIFMMMDELKGLRKDLRNKPVTSSTVTAGGILTATHKGNTTLLKRQRYYT